MTSKHYRHAARFYKPLKYVQRRFSDSYYSGPLHNIRVCDMSRVLVGPYCSMVLGDMGAEIIKIERPGLGDETRHWGPPFLGTESAYFISINRNKKSICVDVKTKEGKDIIQQIVKKSDVFLENFQPGKMDSLGFGYNTLSKINPSLIYCSMTGYGSTGSLALKPGYDLVASAVGGMIHVTGHKDGEPCRSGVAVTDILTGLYMHGAICAALYERTKTGQGKKIETSLFQSQIAMLHDHATSYLNTGKISMRQGTGHSFVVPYQSFKTTDRDLVIAAGNDKFFANLCKALNLEDLLFKPTYATNAQRVENRESLVMILQERLLDKSSSEWLQILYQYNVPCSLVNDIKEAFATDQVRSLGIIQDIEHPTAGTVKISGPAVEYNGESVLSPPLPPPLLGQHTTDIMTNLLNYDGDEVKLLLEKEVLYQNNVT